MRLLRDQGGLSTSVKREDHDAKGCQRKTEPTVGGGGERRIFERGPTVLLGGPARRGFRDRAVPKLSTWYTRLAVWILAHEGKVRIEPPKVPRLAVWILAHEGKVGIDPQVPGYLGYLSTWVPPPTSSLHSPLGLPSLGVGREGEGGG